MDCNAVNPGMTVRVVRLEGTEGMLIHNRHLACRKVGVVGIVKGYVPGHGGDVWFVAHEGSDDVGAYMFTEMEPEGHAAQCVQAIEAIGGSPETVAELVTALKAAEPVLRGFLELRRRGYLGIDDAPLATMAREALGSLNVLARIDGGA